MSTQTDFSSVRYRYCILAFGLLYTSSEHIRSNTARERLALRRQMGPLNTLLDRN